MEKNTAYLVFELGQLQVYTLQGPSFVGLRPGWEPGNYTDNYYWRDPASPQGYGPFNHITACVEHYQWIIRTARGSKQIEAPLAEVIRMNFKSKKRVISDI